MDFTRLLLRSIPEPCPTVADTHRVFLEPRIDHFCALLPSENLSDKKRETNFFLLAFDLEIDGASIERKRRCGGIYEATQNSFSISTKAAG